ncbi:DDT domain-containing protein DDR4 isoform X2 [Syzygium oleosum]|uniref:DDT domain-containing protein DDR4 isoform X2 n=1 Tax=Syzygium oleosum TaxID=219896 RepID=UPI0024B8889C|nr:DDT domain-containing protein DDR4 isoform X2 [Syzygium oleosum]
MSSAPPPPIPSDRSSPAAAGAPNGGSGGDGGGGGGGGGGGSKDDDAAQKNGTVVVVPTRSGRPARACAIRAASRLQAAAQQQHQQHQQGAGERRAKAARKEERERGEEESPAQCASSRIVTPLVAAPETGQLPRWSLRSMWELASILNFLHVFRHLLNISVEFSAEEFETALLSPNDTLGDIHMPLLKAIPPITRMALTRDTWVTVLCRKLRDWWHWVAEGELPIVASHGAEVELYKSLDPGVRVVILKALCDIRVEQEDIRSFIENSMKHGIQLSAFRKERIGGDSNGVHYWYEDDPIIGHRLYREIRKVEVKRAKARGSQVIPIASYQWETVATNLDEFQDVSEKLFSSKNRTEVSLGKKLKIDMLPEIERVHKRKERLLKKQHREALLLDNFLNMDGLAPGRSLRDRKPVTYTFDDYDRSINEAIKITKNGNSHVLFRRKQPSPEPTNRREGAFIKPEASANGKWSELLHASPYTGFSAVSPGSPDFDDMDDDQKPETLDRRQRRRPQRYSEKDYVEALSDNEADFDSDDDIVGEAVYDEEYLRKRKQRRVSSSSEGDEEYRWDEENPEEEEEEEEEEHSLGMSDEDSDEPRKTKKLPGRTRRETKLRSVVDLQSGLRRSKRATRNRINYRQYELSESEVETAKPNKWHTNNEQSEATESEGYSMESQDSEMNGNEQELKVDHPVANHPNTAVKEDIQLAERIESPSQEEVADQPKRRFLDLNELAPGSGFDDGPNPETKDDDEDDM